MGIELLKSHLRDRNFAFHVSVARICSQEGKLSKISFNLDKYQQFVWLSQGLSSAVNTKRKGL